MKKKNDEKFEQENEDLEDFSLDEQGESNHCCCEHDECEEKHECKCAQHGKNCHGQSEEDGQYLLMAQRLQADFDNYRRRVSDQLDRERQEGAKSVIEVFLPCLDTFKEAKKSITDEKVLSGVNMIENKILEALASLKVEKIASIGQKFDPNLHNVIAVMEDKTKENDIILEEYQSGWTYNGRVLRYAKVIVNKINN